MECVISTTEKYQQCLVQFRTNYLTIEDGKRQADVLAKTLASFG